MKTIEMVQAETVCIGSKCVKRRECKRYTKNFPFKDGFNYMAEDYSINGWATYTDEGKTGEGYECGNLSGNYPRFLKK